MAFASGAEQPIMPVGLRQPFEAPEESQGEGAEWIWPGTFKERRVNALEASKAGSKAEEVQS
jgi:hypothetical protein